jgi:hypothetical protein
MEKPSRSFCYLAHWFFTPELAGMISRFVWRSWIVALMALPKALPRFFIVSSNLHLWITEADRIWFSVMRSSSDEFVPTIAGFTFSDSSDLSH